MCRLVKFWMGVLMIRELGMYTRAWVKVRTLVLRKEMDSTIPSTLLQMIQSPTWKGWSMRITRQAKMLARESLAARDTARPPMDSPAMNPLMLKPQVLSTVARAKKTIRAWKKEENRPLMAGSSFFPDLLKKWLKITLVVELKLYRLQ